MNGWSRKGLRQGLWLNLLLSVFAAVLVAGIISYGKSHPAYDATQPLDCAQALAPARACYEKCRIDTQPKLRTCGWSNWLRWKRCDEECRPDAYLCHRCLPRQVRSRFTLDPHPDAHLCEE